MQNPYNGGMDPMGDPNQQRKKSLVDALAPPTNTGISGIGLPGGVEAPPLEAPASPESPAAMPAAPAHKYALEGYDAAKLADPNKHDPKYDIGHVMEQFDPHGGLQQAGLMEALNKLGIGQFSATGDRLNVANGSGAFNGMNSWDAIHGSHSGAPGWQFGVDSNLDTAAPAPAQAGGGAMPQPGGAQLDGLLTGDPLAAIQAGIAQQAGGKNTLQQILASLRGGQ